MSKDRLSPLDASFLHLEDASSHMHVAAAQLFAGEPPQYGRLLNHIESRLGLVPRYRQRLAEVPLAQARPRWVDDERFDLRFHVRHTALPEPGSEYELQVLAGRVFSQQLRRDRPLWELWLVSGLEGGRFAILSKIHHALVDGSRAWTSSACSSRPTRRRGRGLGSPSRPRRPRDWSPRRCSSGRPARANSCVRSVRLCAARAERPQGS
jgi:WS/DGAT/MGAT family acyltransferase